MANPTPGQQHVNKLLTDMSIAYVQDEGAFIADKLFPIVPVAKQSDLYATYSKADFLRIDAQLRAPGTESAGSGYRTDLTANYFAKPYALHKDVTDEDYANADEPLQPDRDATIYLTQQLRMKLDKLIVANYLKTGVWATDITGVSGTPSGAQVKQWSAAGSTPLIDVKTQMIAIQQATGYKPNVLTIGANVQPVLEEHADLKDIIKYTQTGIVSTDLMAKAFGVDRVVVAGAVENTAKEGQTASMSFLFGKGALLSFAPKKPSLYTPSAGYIFAWTGLLGGAAAAAQIKQFRMEQLGANRVEAQIAIDPKLVAADCGCYFDSIVA